LSAFAVSAAVAPGLSQSPEAEPMTAKHPARIAEMLGDHARASKFSSVAPLTGPAHSVKSGDARVASAIGPFDLRRLSLADFGDVEP
jgi:hypothetical protein